MRSESSGFKERYGGGRASLVWSVHVADLETPVSAFLKLSQGRDGNIFLLESVEGNASRGRYSMIGFDPDAVWRCSGAKAEINEAALLDREAFRPCNGSPLEALRAFLGESKIDMPAELPPMSAGVFGYLGYDMVRHMERLGPPKPDPIGMPDAILIRPTVIVVFDTVKDEMIVVTPIRPRTGVTAEQAHEAALERLDRVIGVLEALPGTVPAPIDPRLTASAPTSNTPASDYLAMVERAKDYIRAGDIFQVVLSQRYSMPFGLPPFALYRALRRINPAPYLCYLDFGGFQIACSSPEILVRLRGGRITVRPIAGTRRRGKTQAEDEALAAELLADGKECAEHLMLLDLGRNDVGRVAQVGTVEVTDKFFIERYSHVMHIVSNVEGTIDERYDRIDALAAGFPAGTVSGAPKVRAMQIIDELERDKRGIYGGCIGYFGANGDMDTCIVLRTSVIKDGVMHIQAGAGIVYDSVPTSENAECANKAEALVRAAEEAVRFATSAKRGQ